MVLKHQLAPKKSLGDTFEMTSIYQHLMEIATLNYQRVSHVSLGNMAKFPSYDSWDDPPSRRNSNRRVIATSY